MILTHHNCGFDIPEVLINPNTSVIDLQLSGRIALLTVLASSVECKYWTL